MSYASISPCEKLCGGRVRRGGDGAVTRRAVKRESMNLCGNGKLSTNCDASVQLKSSSSAARRGSASRERTAQRQGSRCRSGIREKSLRLFF